MKAKYKLGEYIPLQWGEDGGDLPDYEIFYGHVDLKTCLNSWEKYAGNTLLNEKNKGNALWYYCKLNRKNEITFYSSNTRNTMPVTVVDWTIKKREFVY